MPAATLPATAAADRTILFVPMNTLADIIRAPRRRCDLLPRLVEIFQVGRRLALAGRHQLAVGAEEIALLADHHVMIVLDADVLVPGGVAIAVVGPRHRPWSGQRMIDDRDLVAQNVR